MAAVQALYQIAVTERTAQSVLEEFIRFRLSEVIEAEDGGPQGQVQEPDREMFSDIVRGVIAKRTDLDEMIAAALVEGWTLERMDRVMQAILGAGAYELFARADVPAKVVITQYVDIAHAFFDGKEPGFVNGVLDRLARSLRPEAFETSAPDTP